MAEENDRDQAAVRLIELAYNTPDDKLSQLTKLRPREIIPLATMEMFGKLAKAKVIEDEHLDLFDEWRIAYYKHKRSEDGAHLDNINKLAENEMADDEQNSEYDEE